MRERKQNVFDDFIACAEQLVADGYTSPQHLAMLGGSNGGLLVGVVMEQRPELFAAAIPVVGVLDMLRYDRFTGGRAWVTEYGSSSDAGDFAFLIAILAAAQHRRRAVPSRDAGRARPTTTIGSCRATRSSSPRRCSGRRAVRARY